MNNLLFLDLVQTLDYPPQSPLMKEGVRKILASSTVADPLSPRS